MHFLLSIFELKAAADEPSRDLAALCTAITAAGHTAAVLTARCTHDAPVLPAGVTLCPAKLRGCCDLARRREFVRAYRMAAGNGGFDGALCFGMLPGGNYCIAYPDGSAVPPGRFAFLRKISPRCRFLARMQDEALRPPSQTGICCLSRNQEYYLRHERDVSSRRLTVLPPQIDEALFEHLQHESRNSAMRDSIRQQLGVSGPGEIMLYLHARDWYEHGVDRALAALAVMPRDLLLRTRLFIGGTGGASQNQGSLNDMADELGMPEQCVCHIGNRHSIHEMLTAADLLLFPARREPTGECIVEALLHGVPVICTSECGYSNYAQSAGCPVIPSPFHSETLQDALAFCLPGLAVIRKSVEHFATTSRLLRRSDVLLEKLTSIPPVSKKTPVTPALLRTLREAHRLALNEKKGVLKNDPKRAVTRLSLPEGRFIVKEFKKRPWWHFRDQMKRTLRGTTLLTGYTPACIGRLRDPSTGSSFLFFHDCGEGNFYSAAYAALPEALHLYSECGKVLARLHVSGLFHADTKTTNFVRNTGCGAECEAAVCIVDCDLVRKYPLAVPMKLRIFNAAQFIASTGNAAKTDAGLWHSLVEAFRTGYSRHAHLSHAEMEHFWARAKLAITGNPHIENNLPPELSGDAVCGAVPPAAGTMRDPHTAP